MLRCNAFVFCAALACLAGASAARADILASDSFNSPSYTVGGLNGQTVGGTGFTGAWAQILASDMSIVSPGLVGRPVAINGQAGDRALFANSGFTIPSGQLFISYDITSTTTLSASRLDLNVGNVAQAAYLGGLSPSGDFSFITSGNLGSSVTAQSSVNEIGDHHLVGVLDFTNDQIAIFVDPSAGSFYNLDGTNNADAATAWTPTVSPTLTGYSLIDNFSD